MRLHLAADADQLFHQRLVDVKTARRVDDEHVAADLPGPLEAVLGDVHRVGVGAFVVHGHVQLFAQSLELIHGGRAVDVARHHRRALALSEQELGQLAAGRGLARALQTNHHDHGWRAGREDQLGGGRTHEVRELFVDDLDELLGRCQALEHLDAHGPFLDLGDELLDDLVVDVGLEQGEPDLARGALDILLRQLALPLQPVKSRLELL